MPKINRIKNGPTTSVAISRGWRKISKISFRKKDEARMMPRKNLRMADLRPHQLDKNILKGWHILLHRLHLHILLLRPAHQFGGSSVGLINNDAHAVVTRAHSFIPHEGQCAQLNLGLVIEWLDRSEIDHIATIGMMPYPLRGIHQQQL